MSALVLAEAGQASLVRKPENGDSTKLANAETLRHICSLDTHNEMKTIKCMRVTSLGLKQDSVIRHTRSLVNFMVASNEHAFWPSGR